MAADDGFDAEAWLARQLGKEPAPADLPVAEVPEAPPPLVEPPVPVHPDIPTQAMDLAALEASEPAPAAPEAPVFRTRRELRQAGAFDSSMQGTERLGVPEEIGVPVPPGEGYAASPPDGAELDVIFGAAAFQDYEGQALVPVARQPRTTAPAPGMSRTQKVLLGVAGGLVGALALVALFLVGTRISDWFGGSPAVVASPSPSPTTSASPTVLPLGPLPPGTYAWDELLGTECLEPYESPWQESYTVVDCTLPHAAQMVKRGTFADAPAYPGLEALAAQMNLLCTDPTVIDYALTAGITDLQFSASYAATSTEWMDGHHDYFCFVNRAAGTPLTTTIAKPPVAPAVPAG